MTVRDPRGTTPPPLLTVGHGTLDADAFLTLLHGAGIEELVDIRSFPGSRRVPHFGREAMEEWVPGGGVGYRWERDLGGRRRGRPDSPHAALRHPAFRGYADHMDTPAFAAGLDRVLTGAGERRTAVMCSESVWWRCHRRMVADAAVLLHGVPVLHLMHDGRLTPHPPWDVARVEGHRIVYDGGSSTARCEVVL